MDNFAGSPFPGDFDNGPREYFDDNDDFGGKSKNKKKNKDKDSDKYRDDKSPIETRYEAFTLERAKPKVGERYSWSRVDKRPLPFEAKKLVDMVKAHRKKASSSLQQDFAKLAPDQKDLINRIILDLTKTEKNKHAEWVLVDVQRFGTRTWTRVEVKKIQIVLKRHDKNIVDGGKYMTSSGNNSYQYVEIIDLAESLDKRRDKDGRDGKDGKKTKKFKSFENLDAFEDPLGGLGLPPQPPMHHNNHPIHNDFPQHVGPSPPPLGPLGSIPFDPNGPNEFQPPQFQPPFPQNPRQSFHNENPFQPNPEFAAPGQFEIPPTMDGQDWPHPNHSARERRDSRSQQRRPSMRRESKDAKRLRKLETKFDDLNFKMDNWHTGGDSSEEVFDEDSIFSPPPSDGRSFTPPSSPRSAFSDARPKGSLERRRSSANPKYQPRYRSIRYRDVEVEPGYSHPGERRRYSPDSRRHSRRASVHHAATYDDYPNGRAAEPRYLPAPPPRAPMPRRLTDYAENYDYADYDDTRRQRDRDRPEMRRRSTVQYDPVQEAYEAGRRDMAMNGRRQSYASGGRYV